jgi:hypothetical protein
VSQSSEFCRHNPLRCFSTSVYCCCLFRYRLSPETFGYTLVLPLRNALHFALCMNITQHEMPCRTDIPRGIRDKEVTERCYNTRAETRFRHFRKVTEVRNFKHTCCTVCEHFPCPVIVPRCLTPQMILSVAYEGVSKRFRTEKQHKGLWRQISLD